MDLVCPVDLLLVFLGGGEMVDHVYALDDEDVSFKFHLTRNVTGNPFGA